MSNVSETQQVCENKPEKGTKYFALCTWTTNGKRPEQCIWRDDYVDNIRLNAGNVYESRKEAKEAQDA